MFSVEQKVLGERKKLPEKVGISQMERTNSTLPKKLHSAKGKRRMH